VRHNKLILSILIFTFIFNGLTLKVFAADFSNPPTGDKKLIDLEKVLPESVLNFFKKLETIGADFVHNIKADEVIQNPETGASKWSTYIKNALEWLKAKLSSILGTDFLDKLVAVVVWIVQKVVSLVKSII
jgi:hypothetical protein